MLLMVENGNREVICHAIHWYAKAYNNYTKDYDKNKKSLYPRYCGVNNIYIRAINLNLNKFEKMEDTSQFNEDFTKNYNEKRDEGCFLEVDIQYPKKLHELHNNLALLPERMKIENVAKPVAKLHDQTEYDIHIRNVKQALNHELILKQIHGVIKFN